MKLFPQKDIVLLAIETSCDDTSVSIIKNGIDIATYVESTIKEFRKYGGIVPEIAARGHEGSINNVFNKALAIANVKPSELTHIAYTDHPGLPGSLHIGKIFAKTIATLLDIPLIPIDHMLGHVFSYAINKPEIIKFPFLCLVASGGHTTLYKFNSVTKYSVVNETSDDPIGEALDKIGRNLKLEYPGGVSIDKQYDPDKTNNKTIKHLEPEKNFSFAGIKNHILNQVNEHNMKNIPIDAVLLGSSALK
jgi:N6-L-threonylcarbamoyladenine synthase